MENVIHQRLEFILCVHAEIGSLPVGKSRVNSWDFADYGWTRNLTVLALVSKKNARSDPLRIAFKGNQRSHGPKLE